MEEAVEKIAAEWSVDPELLRVATWEGLAWSYENIGAMHDAMLTVVDMAQRWAQQLF